MPPGPRRTAARPAARWRNRRRRGHVRGPMYTHRRRAVPDSASPYPATPSMTSRPVRRPDARPFADGLPLEPATLLGVLVLIGLLLRALIAGILLPKSGFQIDIVDFAAWGSDSQVSGPAHSTIRGSSAIIRPATSTSSGCSASSETPRPARGAGRHCRAGEDPRHPCRRGVAWLLFSYGRRFLDQGLHGSPAAAGPARRVGLLAAASTCSTRRRSSTARSGGRSTRSARSSSSARSMRSASAGPRPRLSAPRRAAREVPVRLPHPHRRHRRDPPAPVRRSADPAHDGQRDPLRVLTSVAVGRRRARPSARPVRHDRLVTEPRIRT